MTESIEQAARRVAERADTVCGCVAYNAIGRAMFNGDRVIAMPIMLYAMALEEFAAARESALRARIAELEHELAKWEDASETAKAMVRKFNRPDA